MPQRLDQLQAARPDKRVLTYYQDEARFGQQGTITRVWAKVGTRPRAIRQTQYDYLYVFSAVCPETGDACGLIGPHVNTEVMNAFLRQFSNELPADVHAALVLDRAGWHVAGALRVPANITLIHLPPKSPELNPVENLWHYLRSHYGSNRPYKTWDDLKSARHRGMEARVPCASIGQVGVCRYGDARNLNGIRIRHQFPQNHAPRLATPLAGRAIQARNPQ